MRSTSISIAAALILLPMGAQAAVSNCSSLSGAITDATDDNNIPSTFSNAGTDLTCADIDFVGDNAVFTVALDDFDLTKSRITFQLDTDQDPDTGFAGLDSNNNDADIFGNDVIIGFDLRTPEFGARVSTYNGTNFNSVFQSLVGAHTVFDDGFEAIIPLSLFASAGDVWNFKVTAQAFLGAGSSSTGIFDYVTDLGAAPGVVGGSVSEVPIPAALPLFMAGIAGIGGLARRRRAQ